MILKKKKKHKDLLSPTKYNINSAAIRPRKIQNFKILYRQYFLRHVLSQTDECDSASDVVNQSTYWSQSGGLR